MNPQPFEWQEEFDWHEAERDVFGNVDQVALLQEETEPIPDMDGWRIDRAGRRWYSAAWLGLHQ